MGKYIYNISILLVGFMLACSDMNDLHDPYLRNGETIYVGRVDSVNAFPGRERVLLHYWITDPRVKSLRILWNQKNDSIDVVIPEHDPLDTLNVMIENIDEGDYTFTFFSYDNKGHRSVRYEMPTNIYGDLYQQTLSNRPIRNLSVSEEENKITIQWGGSNSANESGIEILYTDTAGEKISLFIETKDLSVETIFENVDISQPVSYQTWYKPIPDAIDSFHAPLTVI